MRTPKPPPVEIRLQQPDRMWPLDLSIVALASLVLYLIVTRLRFDDPRWLFNAWTYAIAVPVLAFVLAFMLRGVASRYVQKSVQLGFLFSVFVHLLMLMLAINVIIFSRYFPDAFTGVRPERSPVHRTVPEYLFRTPQELQTQPDWSQPVETETASPVVPEEQRQLPPIEHTAPRLEVPKPREPEQRPAQKFLLQRTQPSESMPQPADSPSKLARRRQTLPEETPSLDSPTAPTVPTATAPSQPSLERQLSDQQRTRQAMANLSSAAPTDLPSPQPTPRSIAGARQSESEMPMIGESGLQRQRQQPTATSAPQPAGAAPAPPTVAIARAEADADRMLAPVPAPLTRQSIASGAQLSMSQATGANPAPLDGEPTSGVDARRNDLAARAGVPNVTAGDALRAPGRARQPSAGAGFAPAGLPDPAQAVASLGTDGNDQGPGEELGDRLAEDDRISDRAQDRGGSQSVSMSAPTAAAPTLDLLLQEGPVGLGRTPSEIAGVVPAENPPLIASLELSRGARPRRELGGPVTPFGSKIATVESFNRRVLRTQGGAAPTPAGLMGPATEEAIERGLAYLASVQNKDGSWSLQGHGTEVVLRSDTAATGLALLAFQGAGYTHQQHQYADTVSRALEFLIENQRTNGDLYRTEDPLSDRNVAFYSHGIAALALSEAYGMTQDPELQGPAQAALNYIAGTQHNTRGGWRYTAQISSDTSVTGWMMMALKSGQLAGLEVSQSTYDGIARWLDLAQSPERADRYRYNPFAPDTASQRHGREATPTMTAVGMLMRMYSGWRRDKPEMQSAADYLLQYPPQIGTPQSPQRDTYYWYYATQVMFHMGGDHWARWNQSLNPVLLQGQIKTGPEAGSWDPLRPVPDRWSPHAGRLYVTAMNLLNLEVYYRHLPIYEDTAE